MPKSLHGCSGRTGQELSNMEIVWMCCCQWASQKTGREYQSFISLRSRAAIAAVDVKNAKTHVIRALQPPIGNTETWQIYNILVQVAFVMASVWLCY